LWIYLVVVVQGMVCHGEAAEIVRPEEGAKRPKNFIGKLRERGVGGRYDGLRMNLLAIELQNIIVTPFTL